MEKQSLKRCFGMREALTITVGTVIGVGLFTMGGNVVGRMGPSVILATLAALAISIYPALLYAEMGAALPFAGGTYQYATAGLGRPFGMLAGWNFVISMVSVASGEALAFSFYLRTLLAALGVTLPFGDTVLACIAVLAFVILGVCGVEMTGRLQNAFMFFFWGVTVVWVTSMLPNIHLANFDSFGISRLSGLANANPLDGGFLANVAMVWWCFAGFETCCAMGEEIRHPRINLPRALFLAPFLVFAVNGLFQWVLVSIVPADSLAALAVADAPYAFGLQAAGVIGFPLVLLCAGIAFGGDFSTLNASLTAPARYLYTMARDGALPAFLARVHQKRQTPYIAVLLLGALVLLLVGTGSLYLIASLSLFATLLYYIIGMAAAMGLRRRKPKMARPYRTPLLWIGAPVSIGVYLLLMLQLELTAVLAGVAWCVLGLAAYFFCRKRRARWDTAPDGVPANVTNVFFGHETQPCNVPDALSGHESRPILAPGGLPTCESDSSTGLISGDLPSDPPPPTADEKRRMDREYRIWCIVVGCAAVLVVVLFAVSYLL